MVACVALFHAVQEKPVPQERERERVRVCLAGGKKKQAPCLEELHSMLRFTAGVFDLAFFVESRPWHPPESRVEALGLKGHWGVAHKNSCTSTLQGGAP